jgi:hypothetical protein
MLVGLAQKISTVRPDYARRKSAKDFPLVLLVISMSNAVLD